MKNMLDTINSKVNKAQEKTDEIGADLKLRHQNFLKFVETLKINAKNSYHRILDLDRLETEGLNTIQELLDRIESFHKTIQ